MTSHFRTNEPYFTISHFITSFTFKMSRIKEVKYNRRLSAKPKTFRWAMAIRGHHIYKETWAANIDSKVICLRETRREAKEHDPWSIGCYVKRNGKLVVVGHVPKECSQLMYNFLKRRGRHTHTHMQTHAHTHSTRYRNHLQTFFNILWQKIIYITK